MKHCRTAGRQHDSQAGHQDRSAVRSRVSTLLAVCLAALFLTSAACHRAHAKTLPESPPLEVPAVPPRDVLPIEVETPQPVPLPEEPARTPSPRLRPPAREQTPRADEAGRGAGQTAGAAADDAAEYRRGFGTRDPSHADPRADGPESNRRCPSQRGRARAVRDREKFHPSGRAGGSCEESVVREDRRG